jgi:hypothetical protein
MHDSITGEAMKRDDLYAGYEQGQRDAIAAAVQRVEALKPMLWMTKREGGYNCCGCNTLLELYEDCIAAIKGDQP